MSKGGLEPPRPFGRQPLKLVRLPISPLRRGNDHCSALWGATSSTSLSSTHDEATASHSSIIRSGDSRSRSRWKSWSVSRTSPEQLAAHSRGKPSLGPKATSLGIFRNRLVMGTTGRTFPSGPFAHQTSPRYGIETASFTTDCHQPTALNPAFCRARSGASSSSSWGSFVYPASCSTSLCLTMSSCTAALSASARDT